MVAGGTCAYNPEPLAPFVDFFVLGEGEEVTLEYIALYRRARDEDWTKEELLREAARIPGIYVPSFYEPVYRPDGTLEEMRIREGSGAPELVRKRVVEDMNKSYFPVKTIIPLHRDRPRPGDAGAVPGLYPGLPVLSGRIRVPPGAQPGPQTARRVWKGGL